MKNKLIFLTKKLIEFKTIKNNQKANKEVIGFILNNFFKNFKYKIFEKNNYPSVIISNNNNLFQKYKIILNAHLDVIPGKDQQYKPKVIDNKIYGCGALDMKGAAAVEILVFKELADKLSYPIGLQLVTDEEIGGFYGTEYQIRKGIKTNFVIVGEPTNFDIENQAKGIIWLEIEFFGKSTHSAYPWRGYNALLELNNFIFDLKSLFKKPNSKSYESTFNIASIKTNNDVFNKIPDYCKVKLDIRYIPKDKNILKKIRKIAPKNSKFNLILNEPAFFTSKNNFYIKKLKEVAKKILNKKIKIKGGHGSSDIRHFTKIKTCGIEFGPSGGGMGEDNEWVDINSLYSYYQILKTCLCEI